MKRASASPLCPGRWKPARPIAPVPLLLPPRHGGAGGGTPFPGLGTRARPCLPAGGPAAATIGRTRLRPGGTERGTARGAAAGAVGAAGNRGCPDRAGVPPARGPPPGDPRARSRPAPAAPGAGLASAVAGDVVPPRGPAAGAAPGAGRPLLFPRGRGLLPLPRPGCSESESPEGTRE